MLIDLKSRSFVKDAMACDETCYITLSAGAFVILLILLVTCVLACYVHRRRVTRDNRLMLIQALLAQANASNPSSRRSSVAAGSRGYQAVSLFDLYTPPSTPPPIERNNGVT